MLMPRRTKYRKQMRGSRAGKATKGNKVSFGDYGLQALEAAWITSNQIESARIAMTRHIKRGGQIWIRVFPDMPFTKKPAEVKMGKGKGDIEGYCARIKAGQVMFEVDGATPLVAIESLRKGGTKMPIKTKVIARQ